MTGAEVERDMLGAVTMKGSVQLGRGLARMMDRAKESGGYLSYEDAVRLVKEGTEQDPENPSADFANDLRIELLDKLESEFGTGGAVRVFATNGTPLDIFHGVDAFIEYQLPDMPRPARVTVDVSINTSKGVDYKADFVIGEAPDPDNEEEEYLAFVEGVAERILGTLQSQVADIREEKKESRVGSSRAWRRNG